MHAATQQRRRDFVDASSWKLPVPKHGVFDQTVSSWHKITEGVISRRPTRESCEKASRVKSSGSATKGSFRFRSSAKFNYQGRELTERCNSQCPWR